MTYLNNAIKAAKRSPQRGYKVGCCIVKKNEIISTGVNHVPYSRPRSLFSIHAELHALAKARHKDLHGASAWVANIAHSGNVRLAKPCLTCAIALASAGIKLVHYTIDDNNTGTVDLNGEIDSSMFYKAADRNGYRS